MTIEAVESDVLAQNITEATRLVGEVAPSSRTATSGDQEHHSFASGLELEEAR